MSKNNELFDTIDAIRANIDKYRKEPEFSIELSHRHNRVVPQLTSDDVALKHLAHIIAYAHANSERVRDMIDNGDYDKVWLNYDVAQVSQLNPCDVIDHDWSKISSIMSKAKAFYTVQAARAFLKMGAFVPVLNGCGIPKRIHSQLDIEDFWTGFKSLQKQMQDNSIPYLGRTTSLLHLLLHLGYDVSSQT